MQSFYYISARDRTIRADTFVFNLEQKKQGIKTFYLNFFVILTLLKHGQYIRFQASLIPPMKRIKGNLQLRFNNTQENRSRRNIVNSPGKSQIMPIESVTSKRSCFLSFLPPHNIYLSSPSSY